MENIRAVVEGCKAKVFLQVVRQKCLAVNTPLKTDSWLDQ